MSDDDDSEYYKKHFEEHLLDEMKELNKGVANLTKVIDFGSKALTNRLEVLAYVLSHHKDIKHLDTYISQGLFHNVVIKPDAIWKKKARELEKKIAEQDRKEEIRKIIEESKEE